MRRLFGIILLLFYIYRSECKIFNKCELAKALYNHGISKEDLSNWVCLVQAESSGNTRAKGGPNRNGSYDWGLFQINDGLWCKPGKVAGGCKIDCEDLLSDDITVAVKCAKLIKSIQGYRAWYGWQKKCQHELPDISSCFN